MNAQLIQNDFNHIKALNDNGFVYEMFGSRSLFSFVHTYLVIISLVVLIGVTLYSLIVSLSQYTTRVDFGEDNRVLKIVFVLFIVSSLSFGFSLFTMVNPSPYMVTDPHYNLDQKIESVDKSFNELYNNPKQKINNQNLKKIYKEQIINMYGYENFRNELDNLQ